MTIEKRTILQVLGGLIQNPQLLEDIDRYDLAPYDFEVQEYQLCFSAIYNLFHQGVKSVDIFSIDTYLSKYPIKYSVFTNKKMTDFLEKAIELSDPLDFDYWYKRLKKFSAIKRLMEKGFSVSKYYIPRDSNFNLAQQQESQENFDNSNIEDIFSDIIDNFAEVEDEYLNSRDLEGILADQGLRDLKESLKEVPEIGLNLQGKFLNTIARGARLNKFYLFSGPTGAGKSRIALGHAGVLAFDTIYDLEKKEWIRSGSNEKTLYITTEMEYDEIQTLLIAYLSGVNEDIILNGNYMGDEEERVDEAIRIVETNKNLYIDHLPNFDIAKIKARIRMHAVRHNVKYVFFDYIFTTHALMGESSNKGLREDVILGMFSAALKDLANELNIFISSGTQLNGKWEDAKVKNQNLIRGSKAIVDKVDVGVIMLPVSPEESDIVNKIAEDLNMPHMPNMGFHMYKARRSKYRPPTIVWSYADLGTCRIIDLFVTDGYFHPVVVDVLNVQLEFSDNVQYDLSRVTVKDGEVTTMPETVVFGAEPPVEIDMSSIEIGATPEMSSIAETISTSAQKYSSQRKDYKQALN